MTQFDTSPRLICPNCGSQFALTPEYVAQYGGQQTVCGCGAALQIPSTLLPPVPSLPLPGVISYAGPSMDRTAVAMGVWREGNRMVVRQGCGLPDACVKCGGPPNGRPLRKAFYWHHPALALLILGGILLYAIVALVSRKSIRLEVPLCEAHAARRRNMITAGWFTALGGVVLLIGLCAADQIGPGILLGIVTMIIGLIIGAVGGRVLVPRRITDQAAWFTGVGNAYLDALPGR